MFVTTYKKKFTHSFKLMKTLLLIILMTFLVVSLKL